MSEAERERVILQQLVGLAPTALFLFLPFLAGIMKLVFWLPSLWRGLLRVISLPWRLLRAQLRPGKTQATPNQTRTTKRKFLYFDHFIFCLNFMSFLYMLIIVLKISPLPTWTSVVLALTYPPFYFIAALKRVTGFRTRKVFAASLLTFYLVIPVAFTFLIGFFLVSALTA